MDLAAWRAEFPIFAQKTYLNTCSLGPLSRRARAGAERYLDDWEEMGASAWYGRWMGQIATVRDRFARLIHAQAHEIAILPSVSAALSVVSSALDYNARPEVVMNTLDFPTVPYQWQAKAGVRVKLVPSKDGLTVPTTDMVAAVNDRTAAVATTHVLFTTGYVQDIKTIAKAARAKGALSIIDSYHGCGQVPVDVKDLGVDVLISGGLKWLLGGTGIAYMYVREGLHEQLSPSITSWFAHARQFEFDPTRLDRAKDARRFELGTPSVASLFTGAAGLDIVLEVGPERIRRRTLELVDDLAQRLEARKMRVMRPEGDARSGILGVSVTDPPAAVAALAKQGVIVDSRPGRVRISPYFYNLEEENEKVARILAEVQ
ncbi:MAG: aminotransferase class V-fold PLP-dependent enzyme [Thermoplasmatota archaeon]